MGIRETGRKAVRRWTAALAIAGSGITGIASVGTWIAIENAATTSSTAVTTSGTGMSSTGTSSTSTSSSSTSSSSGLSSGSGDSMTSSSGS